MTYRLPRVLVAIVAIAMVAGCSPKVGSERWCKAMQEKSKMDWTASETGDYAKHCLFEDDGEDKDKEE